MLIDFRDLFPKYNIRPKGVLHIGANIGEEAPVYDQLGIKHVIWIEANLKLIPTLEVNVLCYGHQVINKCVSDVDGEDVVFHISNNAGQSSSMLELGTHKTAHPEVHYIEDVIMKTVRIDSLLISDGFKEFDFLNIDLQGAELRALRGMGDLLNQFKWAYLEVNKEPLYVGCDLIDSVDLFMLAKGFTRVETKWCGNTGWGDALYIRK